MNHNHIDNIQMELYISGYENLPKMTVERISKHLLECEECGKKFEELLREMQEDEDDNPKIVLIGGISEIGPPSKTRRTSIRHISRR